MSLESIQYQYKSPMRTGGHTQLACITVVFGVKAGNCYKFDYHTRETIATPEQQLPAL
jgi:hypothetical protein